MGRRGPRPKPSNLILLEGGKPSHKAVRLDQEAKPDLRIPDMPPAILADRDAAAEWKRAGGQLYRLGLITEIDQAVFAAYCFAYSRYMSAERAVQMEAKRDQNRRGRGRLGASGLLIRTKSGNIIQNPAVGIANQAAKAMLRYAIELGLTPSARTRIKPEKTRTRAPETDDFD